MYFLIAITNVLLISPLICASAFGSDSLSIVSRKTLPYLYVRADRILVDDSVELKEVSFAHFDSNEKVDDDSTSKDYVSPPKDPFLLEALSASKKVINRKRIEVYRHQIGIGANSSLDESKVRFAIYWKLSEIKRAKYLRIQKIGKKNSNPTYDILRFFVDGLNKGRGARFPLELSDLLTLMSGYEKGKLSPQEYLEFLRKNGKPCVIPFVSEREISSCEFLKKDLSAVKEYL